MMPEIKMWMNGEREKKKKGKKEFTFWLTS